MGIFDYDMLQTLWCLICIMTSAKFIIFSPVNVSQNAVIFVSQSKLVLIKAKAKLIVHLCCLMAFQQMQSIKML